MVDINFQQYKMLKHIDHVHRILTDNFSTEELEICEFLQQYSKEFLSITKKTRYTSDNKIDLFGLHPAEYTITQAGKALAICLRGIFSQMVVLRCNRPYLISSVHNSVAMLITSATPSTYNGKFG